MANSVYQALLKQRYPKGYANVAFRRYPFAMRVKKIADFTGTGLSLPIVYDFGGGVGIDFTSAQASATASKSKAWSMTTSSDLVEAFAFVTITGKDLMISKGNEGAFIDAKRLEMEMKVGALGKQLAYSLFNDGGGAVDSISATSTSSLTLTNKRSALAVNQGDRVQFADARTGGTLRDSGDYLVVLSADASTGVVRFDTSGNNSGLISGISSLTTGDYMIRYGSYDTEIKGLRKLIPLTAPTSGDSVYGVDRSTAPVALSGWRLDNSSGSIVSNLKSVAEDVYQLGGDPDVCFVNPVNFNRITDELGSKVVLQDQEGQMKWGSESIKVHTSGGAVTVVGDPSCPTDLGWVLTMDTWELHTAGDVPHLVEDDDNESLRSATGNNIELRWRYYANLVCRAPAHNGVFSISAP